MVDEVLSLHGFVSSVLRITNCTECDAIEIEHTVGRYDHDCDIMLVCRDVFLKSYSHALASHW